MGTSGLVTRVGIEPTTNWLKASCSTTELPGQRATNDNKPPPGSGNCRSLRYHPRVNGLILGVLFAIRLPTGVMLDPVAPAHKLGSFPAAIALAPGGDRAAVLLCGFREQGVQIIDT